MRVLMLSWEYPPTVVGGLGRHVEALARELVRAGHRVQVVTRGDKQQHVDEVVDGVAVRRAAVDPLAIDFTTETLLAWAQANEHALLRAALPLLADAPDVIHAHDWLVAQSATTLAQVADRPLVATIHATEAGRHQGWLPAPLNLAIHSVERWLARRADAVVVCSATMAAEAQRLFELDATQVHLVPNGIDIDRWRPQGPRRPAADGPVVAFVGRLVHEKGVQTLLDAAAVLRRDRPGLRVVVAGTGPHEPALRARARRRRLVRSVDWLGFVGDDEVAALFARADVAVVPSLYEPFGIAALEATAARAPLVVADTGGLHDLAVAGIATAAFPPGDVDALVAAIAAVLDDPVGSRAAAARAARIVRRDYTWAAVAERTAAVYAGVVGA